MKILLLIICCVIVTAVSGQANETILYVERNQRIESKSGSDWDRVFNGTTIVLRNGTEIRQSCFSRYELYRDGYLNTYYTYSTYKNGSWEPMRAICKEKRCQVPPIANGTPKLSDGSTARRKVEHDTEVTTVCDAMFKLDPTSKASNRCSHGRLQLTLCIAKGCNTTSIPGVDTLDIFNNSVKLSVGTTVESNENVSVKCRHGFDPDIDYEDPYVMTCDHGDWSKKLTCTPKKCNTTSIPGVETLDIFNDSVKLSVGKTIESMDNVSVKCRPGFDPDINYEDPYVMACDHGDWSKELNCTPRKCNTTSIPGVETLDIFNNSVKLSIGIIVESMENVSVECRHGFEPDIDYEDPYVMYCDHGDWSKELTCTPIVEPSVSVGAGTVAGACIGGGALLILVGVVVLVVVHRRSRQKMDIKPTDSIDNIETEIRANDYGKINQTFPRDNRREGLQTELRANDYGKIDHTGLQTEQRVNPYENVDISEPLVNARGGLKLVTFLP